MFGLAPPQRLLRPLAVVDVRSARIPTEDPSLLVAQGMVPDQEPAVLAIRAPHAPLEFEWQRTGQPLAALLLQSGPVLGMEQHWVAPGVRGQQLFHGEPRVVEQGPVRVQAMPVSVEDDDGLRYGVDDATQLLFALLERLLRPLAVVNVDSHTIPMDDAARRVAHR